MPTTVTHDQAVANAAAKLNNNLPSGVPRVPHGYVCVGYGTRDLLDSKRRLDIHSFPYAWEGGERSDWSFGSWITLIVISTL